MQSFMMPQRTNRSGPSAVSAKAVAPPPPTHRPPSATATTLNNPATSTVDRSQLRDIAHHAQMEFENRGKELETARADKIHLEATVKELKEACRVLETDNKACMSELAEERARLEKMLVDSKEMRDFAEFLRRENESSRQFMASVTQVQGFAQAELVKVQNSLAAASEKLRVAEERCVETKLVLSRDFDAKISDISTRLEAALKERDEAKDTLDAQAAAHREEQLKVEEARKLHEDSWNQKSRDYEKMILSFQAARDADSEANAELTARTSLLVRQLQELRDEHASNVTSLVDGHAARVQALEEERGQSVARIQALEEDARASTAAITDSAKLVDQLHSEKAVLVEQLNEAHQACAKLQGMLEAEAERTKAANEANRKAAATFQADRDRHDLDANKLREQLKETLASLDQEKTSRLDAERRGLALDSTKEELNAAKQELKALKGASAELEATNAELEARLMQSQRVLEERDSQILTLRQQGQPKGQGKQLSEASKKTVGEAAAPASSVAAASSKLTASRPRSVDGSSKSWRQYPVENSDGNDEEDKEEEEDDDDHEEYRDSKIRKPNSAVVTKPKKAAASVTPVVSRRGKPLFASSESNTKKRSSPDGLSAEGDAFAAQLRGSLKQRKKKHRQGKSPKKISKKVPDVAVDDFAVVSSD